MEEGSNSHLAGRACAVAARAHTAFSARNQVARAWLEPADVSIRRVRRRVVLGGHGVPEETIRRRYQRGLENFFHLYQPLADSWEFYDNDNEVEARLIALGCGTMELADDATLWGKIKEQVRR